MEKICMRCLFLGECKQANLNMLLNEDGCGSFQPGPVREVRARYTAFDIAGRRALQQMLKKTPQKKKVRREKLWPKRSTPRKS